MDTITNIQQLQRLIRDIMADSLPFTSCTVFLNNGEKKSLDYLYSDDNLNILDIVSVEFCYIDGSVTTVDLVKNEIINKKNVNDPLMKPLTEEEIEELTSDDKYDYYYFTNGRYVKKEKNTTKTYITDNEYNWIYDPGIIDWFYDSEHSFTEIKK